MADKNVIIIDETEEKELTSEEIEELQRNERLKKLFKSRKKYNTSVWWYASKIINIIGILGIMLGMLLENGLIAAISLGIILVSTILNYACFK